MSKDRIGSVSLSAATIVLAYGVGSVLWIAVSDQLLGVLIADPRILVTALTVKTWVFVAVTGAALAILLSRHERQRARHVSEMIANEQRFRLLAEHVPDVISRYRVLPDPAFEYMSPSVQTVLGRAPAEFYADPGLMGRLVHPADRHLLAPKTGQSGVPATVLIRLSHVDGHWVSLEQRSHPIFDTDGRLIAVEGVARDVTAGLAAQAAVERLNRVLRTLTAANAALVHANSEGELLEAICHVVVEEGAYRYAWVGYREDDEAGTIKPVASAGYGSGYQAGLNVTWHPTERGLGPVGTSIRECRTVVLSDIATDPTYAPWRSTALGLGYASGAAIPLCDESGVAFGTLVIYSDQIGTFLTEEVELLEGLAADLAYGVETLRARAVRDAGDAERIRLVTAIEQTAESVEITDLAATILYVNPAFERITGYSAAEVIGQNPRILQSGLQPPAFYADLWSTLASGATWTGELVNRKKDGSTFIEEASITPIVDARGTLTSYVAVKRDVTSQREIETNLKNAAHRRAQIAATLSGLRAGETPEATAQAIAGAISSLEGMGSPSVLAFDEGGRAVVLGASGNQVAPVEGGGTMSEARSQYLLERANGGAWVEPFALGSGDGPATVDGATIYASIPGEGGPIGLLAVEITDPSGGDDPAAHLPTLVAFAPTARLLLEAPLRIRGAAARSRSRIEDIISAGTFHPVFQPIVEMATGDAVGYEALTRFGDGTPPDGLFAEARGCGLEQELELATLRAAVAASDALPAGCFVSLNVSPALIVAADGLRTILAGRTRPVVLEITEHAAIDDYGTLLSAFVALGAGLRLAVDDAGAGIANFNHLVELRPQFVKVDIGLVRGVNADLTRQAMIVALAHFAGATDCRVIAEGIETEAERAVLDRLEVPLGQGYLFGRPAEAHTWVRPETDGVTARRAAAAGPGHDRNAAERATRSRSRSPWASGVRSGRRTLPDRVPYGDALQ